MKEMRERNGELTLRSMAWMAWMLTDGIKVDNGYELPTALRKTYLAASNRGLPASSACC
jgi:hypothetical protein